MTIEFKFDDNDLKQPTTPEGETYAEQHYRLQKEDRWRFFKEGIEIGKALTSKDVLTEEDLRDIFEQYASKQP